MVQLRPQLHHLDAYDDVVKGKTSARGKKDMDDDAAPRAVEPEARTIDMKVKSAEGDNDTAIKGNNDLLKRMQDEKWDKYNWIDEMVSIPQPSVTLNKHSNDMYRTKNHGINTKITCLINHQKSRRNLGQLF